MFLTQWLCNVGVVWCCGFCDVCRHIRFEELFFLIMLLVSRWAFLRMFRCGCFFLCLCHVRSWVRLYKSFAREPLLNGSPRACTSARQFVETYSLNILVRARCLGKFVSCRIFMRIKVNHGIVMLVKIVNFRKVIRI